MEAEAAVEVEGVVEGVAGIISKCTEVAAEDEEAEVIKNAGRVIVSQPKNQQPWMTQCKTPAPLRILPAATRKSTAT